MIRIRKAKSEDCQELDKMLTLLIRDEYQYDNNINKEYEVVNNYESMIRYPNNCFIVIENEKEIIGYIFGYIKNMGNVVKEKEAKIDALYVKEEYRGNRFGMMLIEEFKKFVRENKVKFLEVQVLNSNDAAYSLYKKEGFNEFKTVLIQEIE